MIRQPLIGLISGATVNSETLISESKIDKDSACSTSLAITCSPKAEIKCLILPLTIIR